MKVFPRHSGNLGRLVSATANVKTNRQTSRGETIGPYKQRRKERSGVSEPE